MYKVLLTGSTGFLGKALLAELNKLGCNTTIVSRDVVDLAEANAYRHIPKKDYDIIYHLAAWTRAGSFCRMYPGDQWLINEQINFNMLKFWKEYSFSSKFISFGTSAVYNTNEALQNEAAYFDSEPSTDYYGYSTSKLSLLYGIRSLNLQYGANYQHFIPSMIYGPNYHIDGRPLHFIYDIMRKIYRYKISNEQVILWGDGSQRRELLYVEDAVKIITQYSKLDVSGIFNLNSAQSFSIHEIANTICTELGVDPTKIAYDNTKGVGRKEKILDNEKLIEVGGIEFTPLAKGLRKTLDWVVENYENL